MGPPEGAIKPPFVDQFANAPDPQIAGGLEIFKGHHMISIRRVQLADAAPYRPAWPGIGKHPRELAEVDAVAPQVRPGARSVGNPSAAHLLPDHLGDLADLVVLVRASDV